MGEGQQRRLRALRRGEIGVARRIVEGVRGAPVGRGVGDRFGRGDVVRIELHAGAEAQRFELAAVGVDRDDRAAALGSGRVGDDPVARRAHEEERRVGRLKLAQRPRRRIERADLPDALLAPGHGQPAVRQRAIGRLAERPRGLAELGLQLQHGDQRVAVPAMQIPPAGRIGDAVERAVGAPFGLQNRCIPARVAGDAARIEQRAVARHVGQPQLGGIPRHARVVPADPGQPRPVGREPRRGIEVVALMQRLGLAALQRHGDEQILRLNVLAPMVFGHADQPPARRVHRRVGVTRIELRRDRRGGRRIVGGLPPEPLVGEVGEVELAAAHCQRAAAVLVDERPRAVLRARDLRGFAVRSAAHHRVAPALVGARFDPVDVVAVGVDLDEAQRAGRQHLRRHRRLPRPIRRNPTLSHRAPPLSSVHQSYPPCPRPPLPPAMLVGVGQVCSGLVGFGRERFRPVLYLVGAVSGGQICSGLFGSVRVWSEAVSACVLSGRGDFAWSGLFRFVRVRSGLVGSGRCGEAG